MVKILNHEGKQQEDAKHLRETQRVSLRQVTPAVHIVLIDETENWCDEVRAKARRLFGVYLFDKRRHVHACEMTPSYELHFLRTIWTNEFPDTHEGEQGTDALEMEIWHGNMDTPAVCYVHTHVIDGLPTISLVKWSGKHYRELRKENLKDFRATSCPRREDFEDPEKLHDEVMNAMVQAEHECESDYYSLIPRMDALLIGVEQ